MKSTVGMLAVLLFVATIAVGQNSLPFPQAANPALQEGTYAPTVVYQNTPSSMAANVGAPIQSLPTRITDNGSPFPMDANPSLGERIHGEAPFLGERHHEIETGSPFPMAADPSR